MPVTVTHQLSATTPDDPNYEIQVKHWNSAHAITLNAVGSEISGAFANGGGITFGLSADGFITAAAPAGAPSPINFSAGTTSSNIGSVVFSNINGISFGLDGSTITATVKTNYLTTARGSTDAIGLNTAQTNVTWTANSAGLSFNAGGYAGTGFTSTTTAGTEVKATNNTAGLSMAVPAYLTTQTVQSQNFIAAIVSGANGDGTYTSGTLSIKAGNNITLSTGGQVMSIHGVAAQTVQTQASGNLPRSGFTTTATAGAVVVGTHDTDGLKLGVPAYLTTAQAVGNYLTTARGSTDAIGLNTAKTNVTWTANSSGLSFDAGGYAGTGTSLSNISITLNTNGIQASVPATSSLVGTFGISVSSNGSTISIQPVFDSLYENFPLINSTVLTWDGASVSHAVRFQVPNPVSFSFLRVPALMTTNSTTIATMASATASAQGQLASTLNAVIYSLGVGGNSRSLQSVTSAQVGFSMSQKISVTNSTQASYTLGVTQQAAGGGTSLSTQYSVSNTNYSFTTDQIATQFSSVRFLDLPFAASLSPGNYWLVIGLSTSSSSAGAAGLAGLTNCNVRYSGHYGNSQAALSFGIMGSTNRSTEHWNGAASFSTAGGGTTNSIPISALSSAASLAFPVFQLARSA